MPKVGVALGGGGARGIAHVAAIEALDEMGVRPHAVAGTSIGALAATAWAAGRSGREIREALLRATGGRGHGIFDRLRRLQWIGLLAIETERGGLLDPSPFLDAFTGFVRRERLEDLDVPTAVVAADLGTREEVVFRTGDLRAAVHASMAIPGIFRPVLHEARVLVDGGCVNPVPHDVLPASCEVTVAIDVLGRRAAMGPHRPGLVEGVLSAYEIMEASLVREKMRRLPPTVHVVPDLHDVRILSFDRAEEVLQRAEPLKDDLKRRLERALEAAGGASPPR